MRLHRPSLMAPGNRLLCSRWSDSHASRLRPTPVETVVETGVTGGTERYGRPSLDGGTKPLILRNAPMMPYISLSCDIFQFNSPSLLISPTNHLTLAVPAASVMD